MGITALKDIPASDLKKAISGLELKREK
jgi:hypothetical protein